MKRGERGRERNKENEGQRGDSSVRINTHVAVYLRVSDFEICVCEFVWTFCAQCPLLFASYGKVQDEPRPLRLAEHNHNVSLGTDELRNKRGGYLDTCHYT